MDFGLIGAATQVGLFAAQWLLVLQLLWISSVLIPFTLIAIAFELMNWLILDKVTNFLLSGNWNNVDQIQISLNSPMIIMLFLALGLGFLFGIIFFINYIGRNVNSISGSEVIKRMFWIFGILIFVLLLPFGFLILSLFVKFCTSLINRFIGYDLSFGISNLSNLKPILLKLSNIIEYQTIDINKWNDFWNLINNQEAIAFKEPLLKTFNKLSELLNKVDFVNLIKNLNNDSLSEIKKILNEQLLNDLQKAHTSGIELISILNKLELLLDSQKFNELKNSFLGSFSNLNILDSFNKNMFLLLENLFVINNIELIPGSNEIKPINNIGLYLFYKVTNIYANSVDGIWGSLTFLSVIFTDINSVFNGSGLTRLFVSITLGATVAMASFKGICTMSTILLNRWYSILILIPYGAFSVARISNDDGSLFKIWIREAITIFISLFVVCLNLTIFNLLISCIANGIDSGNISIIRTIKFKQIIEAMVFCLVTVLLIYCMNSITTRILETFNASSLNKESGINNLASELNAARSNKNQRTQKVANAKKQRSRIGNNLQKRYNTEKSIKGTNRRTAFRKALGFKKKGK